MVDDRQKIKALKNENPDVPDIKTETEVLGYDHCQIGALLGSLWQLPTKLVEALEHHHSPQSAPTPENNLPYLAHLADHLSHLAFDVDPEEEDVHIESAQSEALEFVGVTEQHIMACVLPLREEYVKAETFMEMAKGVG